MNHFQAIFTGRHPVEGIYRGAAQVWEPSPASLFRPNDKGLFLDPSRLDLMDQLAAGGSPVTAPGQPVGLIRRTAGSVDAGQAVSAARPTLGRHPRSGWRNLATGSQAVESSTGLWRASMNSGNYSGVKVGFGEEDGIPYVDYRVTGTKTEASLSYINLTNSNLTAQPGVVVPISAKTGDTVNGRFTARVVSGPPPAFVQGVRLVITEHTDTILHTTGNFVNSATDAVASRDKTTAQANIVGLGCYIQFAVNQGLMAVGDSFDITYRIKGFQFERGLAATSLQFNMGAHDVTEAGQSDLWYLSTDGIDDFLSTTAINWGTDEVTVIAALARQHSEVNADLVGLSATPGAAGGKFALSPTSDAPSLNAGFSSSGDTANALARAASTPILTPIVLTGMGKIDNDTALIRRNGVQIGINAVDQGAGIYNAAPLFIGARGGLGRFFAGRIYGLLVINRTLNPAEMTMAERYMASKCGVTLP